MSCWRLMVVSLSLAIVNCAVISDDGTVDQQGLYSKSDQVTIITGKNFDRAVYGKKYAQLVQFYNSYCGHCRAFAPVFKNLARELIPWQKVLKLGAIDCFNEDNIQVCREFEVMAYPTLRYLHENYNKANGNIGVQMTHTDTAPKLQEQLIHKLQSEQLAGRFLMAPSLSINSYSTLAQALLGVPRDKPYSFLILEGVNSTVGSELILDTINYNVDVRRVNDESQLAAGSGITKYPGIIAVEQQSRTTPISLVAPTKENLLKAIISYLNDKNFVIPEHYENTDLKPDNTDNSQSPTGSDVVYYSDLENTVKATLHTEITRFKSLTAENHEALITYLQILRDFFPFKGNDKFKTFLTDLEYSLRSAKNYGGEDIYRIVKSLEAQHKPYKADRSEYIGCKGSQPQYRGFTCGLWTLFHTLVTSAAARPGSRGPKVLQAMHGYVKNFFGCTHCVQHFTAMAARNRLFDVKENDKAVLWLWISHNEVNLRIAGDVTEDPRHPKIQYPSIANCPECRQARGAWELPAVYKYLRDVYGSDGIRDTSSRSVQPSPAGPFSKLDIGMLSFLYILSFIILILVIKFFLTKRFYRKRIYKHGRGKV